MRNFLTTLIYLIYFIAFIGCSTSSKKESDGSVKVEKSKSSLFGFFETSESSTIKKKISWKEEMELNQARLWAQVEQMKSALRKHNAKIRILSRGSGADFDIDLSETNIPEKNEILAKEALTIKDTVVEKIALGAASYISGLAKAKKTYGEGEYGKAFIQFEALLQKYEKKMTHGEPSLWKARCWQGLREFEKARDVLVQYTVNSPKSPFVDEALIELSKVELKLGFSEIASKRLQGYIQKDPSGEFVEVARQMLSNIENTL